jgi:tetratricopeptide (TPR) repeat protein
MTKPDVESLCHRGRAAIKARDYPSAKDAFSQAVAADPDNIDGHEGLATVAYLAGDFEVAIAEYDRLTKLKPLESRYYTNIGAIYNRKGEYMKAADWLRKAIQRNKKCAESYYNLGIAQRKLKQNAMAVSAYKEAIKIDPSMAEAYQNLGNVYVDMGNLQLAVTNFKKALEIKPDFEKARAGLEKAEEQLRQSKNMRSPFGRLVAMESTVKTVAPTEIRELREDERYDDRKHVKKLAEEMERLAKACVEHMKLKLLPSILDVERAMAHGVEEKLTLVEAAETFREATVQWGALRRSLKRKVLELRAHEEFMNAPDVQL